MKVKCHDCGKEYEHLFGDYGPTDVCGECFDAFDGMREEDLVASVASDLTPAETGVE